MIADHGSAFRIVDAKDAKDAKGKREDAKERRGQENLMCSWSI